MRDDDYRQELSCRRSVLVNSSVPSESLASSRSHTSEDVLPVPRGFDATSASVVESAGSVGSTGSAGLARSRAGRVAVALSGGLSTRGGTTVGVEFITAGTAFLLSPVTTGFVGASSFAGADVGAGDGICAGGAEGAVFSSDATSAAVGGGATVGVVVWVVARLRDDPEFKR